MQSTSKICTFFGIGRQFNGKSGTVGCWRTLPHLQPGQQPGDPFSLGGELSLLSQIEWFEKFGTDDISPQRLPLSPSRRLGNLFNAYAKAVNKAFDRSGSLFQKPFQRIPVTKQSYLVRLICYIHRNPQRHGLSDDFTRWPYSSYRSLLSSLPTRLERESVLGWFGGQAGFRSAHQHDWSNEGERLFYEAGAGDNDA